MRVLRKAAGILFASALSLGVLIGGVPKVASAENLNKEGKAAAKAELNLDKGAEYHAYILFTAQNSWVYRGRFFEKDNGVEYKYWNNMVSSLDKETPEPVDGKITDTVISGNGHYSVKITDLNGSPSAGVSDAEFGILGFTTDIPMNDTIKFDNVKVTVDGVEKGTKTGADVYYDKDDVKDPGLITVEVLNAWQEECNSMSLMLPNDSVEISFDVSGFHFDNPDAVEKTETTKAPDTSEQSKETKDTESKSSSGTVAVVAAIVVVIGVVGIVLWKRKK